MSSYRSNHGNAASKRTHNEGNQQILKTLVKQGSNTRCADCKVATNPRWASWNLGIYICIRCSGIHRSMGTHISKVKSIDLDSWTDEQVKSMVNWGNEKSNIYWEHNLPKDYVPEDSKIQNFIRTKYELKKWVSTKNVPDPSTITCSANASNIPNVMNSIPRELSSTSNSSLPQTKTHRKNEPDVFDLLGGLDDSNPRKSSASSSANSTASQPVKNTTSSNLLDLNFGSSAPSLLSSNTSDCKPATSTHSTMNSGRSNRPDLKKSILALYSKPANTNKSANNIYSQPQFQSTGSLSNSLTSLNLNATTTSNSIEKNVWNSSTPSLSSSQSQLKSNNSFDGDLLKNVWK